MRKKLKAKRVNYILGATARKTVQQIAEIQSKQLGRVVTMTSVVEDAILAYAAALGVNGKGKP
jgi:hypothetical protein